MENELGKEELKEELKEEMQELETQTTETAGEVAEVAEKEIEEVAENTVEAAEETEDVSEETVEAAEETEDVAEETVEAIEENEEATAKEAETAATEDDTTEDVEDDFDDDEDSLQRFPTVEAIQEELNHERYKRRFRSVLRSTFFSLLVAAAITVILAVIVMPVLQIIGSSMAPTLEDGNIVLAINGSKYKKGDVIAFYYNNNILIKRVIGVSGDWIDIDEAGNVFVNGEWIDEPYLIEKSFGETNIELPYQVPENRIFVMGDNRAVSIDSRNTAVGCINKEMVVGRLLIRVWPLDNISLFTH